VSEIVFVFQGHSFRFLFVVMLKVELTNSFPSACLVSKGVVPLI